MKRKQPFVVGRRTQKGTLVVLLADADKVFPGPWTLRAVVSDDSSPAAA